MKAWRFQVDRGKRERQMRWVMNSWATCCRFGQQVGPYLVLEIVLPGGTLLALLLFLYQRRKLDVGIVVPGPARLPRRERTT